ncbi:MAG: FG-GAP repeat protein, partial [Saprospiraceae bacterium]|nr:FG-GAP repeat protein [Candidatus Opimibacter skivensis]
GYGVWGDCGTNGNITEYNPVADTAGVAGDFFGNSVSISGDFAIVGSPNDDETNNNQGSATIYHFNQGHWTWMQKITDPTGFMDDNFGISVSLSGNFAIVGAYNDDGPFNNQGSVSVFQYNGISWDWLEKITDPDGAASDHFGFSVSMSGDNFIAGSYLDDSSPGGDQGSACVFHFDGTNWVFVVKLTDPLSGLADGFGSSVSLAGNNIIVGSPYDDAGANTDQGSASIYQYDGNAWVYMQKVIDSDGASSDYFGSSVTISNIYAAIGSPGDKVGNNEDQGSATVFRYNGSSWVSMQKKTSITGLANDGFGISLSISGDFMLVGSGRDDIGVNVDQGSISMYQRLGNGWQLVQFITEPGGNASDFFGSACALDISTRRFLSGASGYIGNTGKAVFGKIN